MNPVLLILIALGLIMFFNSDAAGASTPSGGQAPQDFINTWYPVAQLITVASYIPAAFQVAQAALESGDGKGKWGASDVVQNANNYFGIKADSSWTGDTYKGYRKYATPHDSWIDHAAFLVTNNRYKQAFTSSAGDDNNFAAYVAQAGYATDPDYLKKIVPLIAEVKQLAPAAQA